MMEEKEVLALFMSLRRETLHVWVERGWVTPERGQGGYRFREIDVARVSLIQEFSTELELSEDAMDVILPLLDQVHGLRHELRCFAGRHQRRARRRASAYRPGAGEIEGLSAARRARCRIHHKIN